MPTQPLSEVPEHKNDGTVLTFVHAGDKTRLDLFLCKSLPGRSRSYVQKLIEEGWVRLPQIGSDVDIKASTAIRDGFTVEVTLPPSRKSTIEPEDIPIEVLYEDRDLAVIDKPPGLIVHPSAQQLHGTLVNGLLYRLDDLSGIGGEERPGIVHRLDRHTSGVMIVAKNDRSHQILSAQFKDRTIKKVYLAIVRGEWTAHEGTIDLPIGRSYFNRKRMMVRTDGFGRESLTRYRILEAFDGYAFVKVEPQTGRTHQIRVHMAKIRLPVACDNLYGREQKVFLSDLVRRPRESGERPLLARQALHANSLRFRHPVGGEELEFQVPLPQDIQSLLEALRQHRLTD
jgi:23S rRNA pseudouridine1911/1915/1917 synthase